MALLVLPACLLVLGLLIGPMILMFRISLNHFSPTQLMIEAFSFDNYVRAAQDPYYQEIILTTLGMALLCTALTLVIAYPAAYWVGRLQSRWKSLVVIATLFPLLVGNVVRSAGWMALFTRDGLINTTLLKAHVISEPLALMYTPKAVVFGIVAVVLPYMILTISAVIESIPRDLEDAAANLGASAMRTFWRVILPLVRARRRGRLDPGLRFVHEHLCNRGASRRPAFQDDGAGDLRPVRARQQLADGRGTRLHAAGGDHELYDLRQHRLRAELSREIADTRTRGNGHDGSGKDGSSPGR